MSARLLAVIVEGQEAAALGGMSALAAVARAERALVRLAYFRRLPRPRVSVHDRIIAPVEIEMARVEAAAVDALGAAARMFDDVVMEPLVRFGRPHREAALEVEAFAPDLVVLVTGAGAGPLARLRAWALRRRLSRAARVRMLVLQTSPAAQRRAVPGSIPRWHGGVAREAR